MSAVVPPIVISDDTDMNLCLFIVTSAEDKNSICSLISLSIKSKIVKCDKSDTHVTAQKFFMNTCPEHGWTDRIWT